MSRCFLGAVLLLAGCPVTPILTPPDDDGTGETDTPSKETDGEGDSDGDEDSGDTDLDTYIPGGNGGHGHLPKLDCHPYDPISHGTWSRTYNLRIGGGGTGIETHTALGLTASPSNVATTQDEGWAYKIQVTNAGSNNYNSTYWADCNNADELSEYAYTYTVQGETLSAGATKVQKTLPNEDDFDQVFAPAWQVQTRYKLKVPTGYKGGSALCPKYVSGSRDVDAQYTGMGFENITVQGLGLVEAYKINVILNQTQQLSSANNPLQQFGCAFLGGAQGGNPLSVFLTFFQAAAGFTPGSGAADDGAYITASIDKWYVRGVGLVKEKSVDFENQGRLLYEKELTKCSGLPNCP